MTIFRCCMLSILGTALCIGCSDNSSQSWEAGKSQPGGKPSAKPADVADNDAAGDAADSAESPHGMTDPRGMVNPHGMNPHAGMPMAGGPSSTEIENDGKLDAGAAHWSVPKSWVRKQPKMSMILAEYGIPKAEGDKEDGRLTVTQAGGSLEGNIARWKGQVDGKPEEQKQETVNAGGIEVSCVDLTGTYDDQMGRAGPRGDYRLLGAAFQLPGDQMLTFVKCYGPKKTIAAHADEIKAFIRSMKVDQ